MGWDGMCKYLYVNIEWIDGWVGIHHLSWEIYGAYEYLGIQEYMEAFSFFLFFSLYVYMYVCMCVH